MRLTALWLVIAVVGSGFAAAAYLAATRPPDPVAACARGGPVEASTVILVDTTDALTPIQQRRVKITIEAERDRLPRGGKLTVLALDAAASGEPAEIVSACNPGSPGDANPLFETASRAGKHWTSGFAAPVEAAIAKVSVGTPAANSPIIATLASLLTRPDFDARTPDRRLVIVSDMLEHDQGDYSQLRGGDFWSTYRRSPLAARISLDLRGVAIAIDYLDRPAFAAVQGERHRRFWQRLFTEAGAGGVIFIGRRAPREDDLDDPPAASPPTPPPSSAITRQAPRRAMPPTRRKSATRHR